MVSVCNQCGVWFEPKNKEQKYCSESCFQAAGAPVISIGADQRTRMCAWCGSPFTPGQKHKDYCDTACAKNGKKVATKKQQSGHPKHIYPKTRRRLEDIKQMGDDATPNDIMRHLGITPYVYEYLMTVKNDKNMKGKI